MSLNYLLDENVAPSYKAEILTRHPDLIIWCVGEPHCPSGGTLDPEILKWCEEYNFILVTNNRKSMSLHLADHLAECRHIPGIFLLNSLLSIGQNIRQLIFIAEASFDDEYQDQIVHLREIV